MVSLLEHFKEASLQFPAGAAPMTPHLHSTLGGSPFPNPTLVFIVCRLFKGINIVHDDNLNAFNLQLTQT